MRGHLFITGLFPHSIHTPSNPRTNLHSQHASVTSRPFSVYSNIIMHHLCHIFVCFWDVVVSNKKWHRLIIKSCSEFQIRKSISINDLFAHSSYQSVTYAASFASPGLFWNSFYNHQNRRNSITTVSLYSFNFLKNHFYHWVSKNG